MFSSRKIGIPLRHDCNTSTQPLPYRVLSVYLVVNVYQARSCSLHYPIRGVPLAQYFVSTNTIMLRYVAGADNVIASQKCGWRG